MEGLNRIMKQIHSTISHNTRDNNIKYKCNICKDVGWIQGKNGWRRCVCYKKELAEKRWKKFGVDPRDVKLIKDYNPITEIQKKAKIKAIKYIEDFNNISKQRNNSIAFLGQPGAGKTHLALGIGKELLEKKYIEVTYMPYLEAIKALKLNCLEKEQYFKMQSKYINSQLLIIDDLFKDKVKKGKLIEQLCEADIKHIYPIINQRYINNRPTIYSSECSANMLLDLDEALAGRILETCKHNLLIFNYCKENNYRMREFA